MTLPKDEMTRRLLADLEEARLSARMLRNDFVEYLISMALREVSGGLPEQRRESKKISDSGSGFGGCS